jgi:hypothetical protein
MTRKTCTLLLFNSTGREIVARANKTHFEQVPLDVVKKIAAGMVPKKNGSQGKRRPDSASLRRGVNPKNGEHSK